MPFLKLLKGPLFICSLNVAQIVLMMSAPNTLYLQKFSGAMNAYPMQSCCI